MAASIVADVRDALVSEYFALVSPVEDDILPLAVLLANDAVDDVSRRLPIHLAVDKNAPTSILRSLLRADVHKYTIGKSDKWGDLPLHTACSRHQTDVVQLLLECDATKHTLFIKSDNGSLALHAAVRYRAPASVIMLLLENDDEDEEDDEDEDDDAVGGCDELSNRFTNEKSRASRSSPPGGSARQRRSSRSTLLESDAYGQLPIHAACRNGAHPDVIHLLIHHDTTKETVIMEDNVGRLPLHLTLLHGDSNYTSHNIRAVEENISSSSVPPNPTYTWFHSSRSSNNNNNNEVTPPPTNQQLEVLHLLLRGMFVGRMEYRGVELWKKDLQRILKSMIETHERDFVTRDKLDMVCDSIQSFMDRARMLELVIYHYISKNSESDIILREVIPFLENEIGNDTIQRIVDAGYI
jgi:ankyrin repeat protein